MRNAVHETTVAITCTLLHEGGESADKVNADLFARTIECDGNRREVFCFGSTANLCNRRDGDALMDNGNSKLAFEEEILGNASLKEEALLP